MSEEEAKELDDTSYTVNIETLKEIRAVKFGAPIPRGSMDHVSLWDMAYDVSRNLDET